MIEKMHFFCERQAFTGNIEFKIGVRKANGDLHAADNIIFNRISQAEIVPSLMSFTPDQAQELLDELWQCGVRPTNGAGSTGQLAATENHVKDLRTIAFKLLKIESINNA